jgi:hypothetical protein
MKIKSINKDWCVMFSGPVSPMTSMIDAITEKVEKLRPMNFRAFARLCRDVYCIERKPLIESEILGDYDIENYAEYFGMRKTEPEYHARLADRIRE